MWNDITIGNVGNSYSATKVYEIDDETRWSISQNSQAYWITRALRNMGMQVAKDTIEGKVITRLIELRRPADLEKYTERIFIRHVTRSAIPNLIERACYQHCCLRWVMNERMTNQSLRTRFNLAERKSAVVSQIISATCDAGLMKPDSTVGTSRRFARYLPVWA